MPTYPVFGYRADDIRPIRRASYARRAATLALACVCLGQSVVLAQAPGSSGRRGGGDSGSERKGASPQEIQSRILTNLRDRFGVTDDEEWAIISERMLKVFELRRSTTGGGGSAAPAAAAAMAKSRGGFRPGGGSPELQALQSAVNDKLPEAELKLRMTRLREVRQLNEAKLHKAQEDLRAVLTVRQEAVAVLLGLLP